MKKRALLGSLIILGILGGTVCLLAEAVVYLDPAYSTDGSEIRLSRVKEEK